MIESSERHKAEAPDRIGFALVMCSSSRFLHVKQGRKVSDPSGDLIVRKVEESGNTAVSRTLVSDDKKLIQKSVEDALKDEHVSAVIVCGGTGIAPGDVTIEAVTPMLGKILPGFGELFRKLSYEKIGSAAILTRAIAGVTDGKAVFCIPGSVDAVSLSLDRFILPEAGHIVKHARELS